MRGADKKDGTRLDFIDVRRAYVYDPSKRTVYVELPQRTMRKACVANWSSRCTDQGCGTKLGS